MNTAPPLAVGTRVHVLDEAFGNGRIVLVKSYSKPRIYHVQLDRPNLVVWVLEHELRAIRDEHPTAHHDEDGGRRV